MPSSGAPHKKPQALGIAFQSLEDLPGSRSGADVSANGIGKYDDRMGGIGVLPIPNYCEVLLGFVKLVVGRFVVRPASFQL